MELTSRERALLALNHMDVLKDIIEGHSTPPDTCPRILTIIAQIGA